MEDLGIGCLLRGSVTEAGEEDEIEVEREEAAAEAEREKEKAEDWETTGTAPTRRDAIGKAFFKKIGRVDTPYGLGSF